MARINVDTEDTPVDDSDAPEEEPRRRRRSASTHVDVEIEREVTKRQLVESVTSILVVILYMAFTLLRERESGLIVLDDEGDYGPEDDWVE
jgi:hypothetical protein